MSTMPMAQPATPDAGGSPASPSPGGDQANVLQQTLGKLMQVCLQLGQQNQVISAEMQEAATAMRQAFLKTVQAAQPMQPQQAPPGQ